MKSRIGLTLAALAIFLSGCASPPQQAVQLDQSTIGPKKGRIAVAMAPLPKVDTDFPGAGCLLCMAAASVANSSLTTHARTLPYEDLPKLKGELADLLRKKGNEVAVITEDLNVAALPDASAKGPNIAKKDFSSLRQKYSVDKLLVVEISALGFVRPYSAYIPTSDPKGVLNGTGYIVNLNNNSYEWYLPVSITKSADKSWDEPPKFPGLTNAYFQALELGKDSFARPFLN